MTSCEGGKATQPLPCQPVLSAQQTQHQAPPLQTFTAFAGHLFKIKTLNHSTHIVWSVPLRALCTLHLHKLFSYSLHPSFQLLFACFCFLSSSKELTFYALFCFALLHCKRPAPSTCLWISVGGPTELASAILLLPVKINPFPLPVSPFFQIFSFFPPFWPSHHHHKPNLFRGWLILFLSHLHLCSGCEEKHTIWVQSLSSKLPFPGAPEVSCSLSALPLEAAETDGTNPVLRVMYFTGSWGPGAGTQRCSPDHHHHH